MATKKAVGRPPKYKCKEEIEEKIDAYFKECEGELLRDGNGEPVMDKFGHPITINSRPPTLHWVLRAGWHCLTTRLRKSSLTR